MGLETLAEIIRAFSEVFDLSMVLADANGRTLTEPHNLSEFCRLVRSTEEGLRRCRASDHVLAGRVKDAPGPVITRCTNVGLMDAALPIRIGGRHVASWLVGQFCPPEVDIETVRRTAHEIGVDEDVLIAAFHKLRRRPVEHMEKALKMLELFTQEISAYGLNNLRLVKAMVERQQKERAAGEQKAAGAGPDRR